MKVKICGITNVADGLAAAEAGADFLGFIFHPKSPRYVSIEQAQAIMAAVRRQFRPHEPKGVGVFVNIPPAQVQHVIYTAGLAYAQLHGDETDAEVAALRSRAYKALPLHPTSLGNRLVRIDHPAHLGLQDGPSLLVDAFSPASYGGTGTVGDWALAAEIATRTPRLLLAGGLTPENVAAAIAAVHPWGVDVSSGVEASPGRKDHAKVAAFIAAARGV